MKYDSLTIFINMQAFQGLSRFSDSNLLIKFLVQYVNYWYWPYYFTLTISQIYLLEVVLLFGDVWSEKAKKVLQKTIAS